MAMISSLATVRQRGLVMEVVSIAPVDLSDAQRIDASTSDG